MQSDYQGSHLYLQHLRQAACIAHHVVQPTHDVENELERGEPSSISSVVAVLNTAFIHPLCLHFDTFCFD